MNYKGEVPENGVIGKFDFPARSACRTCRNGDFTGSSRNGDSTPIDLGEASLKFGPSAKSSCFTKGRSKRILNTIALISPFGTHQVALEPALPVPQGSPQHGLYPNENTTAEESKNVVPKGVGSETTGSL
jgi:hypothetical protein